MERTCEGCGVRYVAKTKRSRFHSPKCAERSRKRRKRAAGDVVPIDAGQIPSVVAMTREVLVEADRVNTPAGANALRLAAKLDAGGDTGSAMAALSKQHLAALEVATADVEREGDVVRDLEERRARRLSVVGS